jgi:hypothetical protein
LPFLFARITVEVTPRERSHRFARHTATVPFEEV